MSGVFFDGLLDVAKQHGPIVPGIHPESRGRIWTQTMLQKGTLWAPLDLDTAAPGGLDGILTEETRPSQYAGPVFRWDRIFHEVPDAHTTMVAYSYIYPKPNDDGSLSDATVSTTVEMDHEYFNTDDPASIELVRKKKFDDEDDLIFFLGTIFDADRICADDSKVDRYAGNIWVRKTPYVNKLTLLAALA